MYLSRVVAVLISFHSLESWSTVEKFVGANLASRIQSLMLDGGSVNDIEKQESVLRGKFVASHDWSMNDLRTILREKQKFISKT